MPSVTTDRLYGSSSGLAIKAPCVTVTSGANIALSGLQTINGVALSEGDRVLVKDQTDQTTNGIYVASASGWERDADFDGAYDAVHGTLVIVNLGTGVTYRLTTANPVNFGTSLITFAPYANPSINYVGPGDVRAYGADPTGVLDSTAAWQAAIAANTKVHVPEGTYKLAVGSITLPVGVEVFHADGATINVTSSGLNYIYNCSGRNRITGGYFVCADDNTVVAQAVGAVNDVLVKGVTCLGPRALYSNSSAVPTPPSTDQYPNVTDANSPSNIRAVDCFGTSQAIASGDAFITFWFTLGFLASGCSTKGYDTCVEWWGGDSNPTADGVVGNDRKCRDGRIIGCFSLNAVGGGIWGSMGKRITIQGCQVVGAGDVGIDFEGCWDSVAVGCTSVDCAHANFSTFYYNRNVAFRACQSALTGAAGLNHFYTANAAQNGWFNVGVAFTESECSTTGGGLGVISDALGPAQGLLIARNKFRNCKVSVTQNNNGSSAIEDNEFSFDVAQAAAFNVIEVKGFGNSVYGRSTALILRNKIKDAIANTFAAGSAFISLTDTDSNFSNLYRIEGNENLSDNGPPNDVLLKESGTNAGNVATWVLERNRFLNATPYTKTESGAGTSVLYYRENATRLGVPIPAPAIAPAFGAAVNLDASMASIFQIVANAATAFTINNPTNLKSGQRITLLITNSSGGVMGAITWGNLYRTAGAFTNPANGFNRTITFEYNGGDLYEVSRTAADAPN